MGDKGSSVVELSLIMPIIFGILTMIIFLFLDTVEDGVIQQQGYSMIYTYQEDMEQTETIQVKDSQCRFEKNGHVCVTEVDLCSKRLRRWQVYGSIVWE